MLCALSTLAAFAPSARAFDVYGIWWMPDKSDDDGFGLGLKDERSLTPLFAIDARVSYVNFSTPDIGVFPIEATGLVNLGLWHVGVGMGFYFFNGDYAVKDGFGWYALVGLEIGLGRLSALGEVKWQQLEPDLDGAPGTANLDALAIHLGAAVPL
jgi:hypothetical protein